MHKEFLIAIVACVLVTVLADPIVTTANRVKSHGYPVEDHTVQTSDGYILKMFRIPYSHKLGNKNVSQKPVVFLLHGLLTSSDSFILNGPNNALAFLLADAGYDVWMGNNRGNTYSKKHASKSPLMPSFWEFSWNEMGIYDLPAMMDYVLNMTHENALHFVGHSQGTTVLLVLLSSIPRYNSKIKTSHFLGPIGYIEHLRSSLRVLAPIIANPSLLSKLLGGNQFLPNSKLLSMLGADACANKAVIQQLCGNIVILVGGWDSHHLNYTLVPDVLETHTAGSSTSQFIHYLQEYESGHFRKYDFGKKKNKEVYGQEEPPDYLVENIQLEVPIEFYYSDNDNFAALVDVERMVERLGRNARRYHIKYSDWNHVDFIWALDVKEVINDHIIQLVNAFEGR